MTQFNREKYVVSKETEMDLSLSDGEVLKLKVRSIPWSKRNQIRATAIKWDTAGRLIFDGDYYLRECLKYMIVEAPWGITSDIFLSQINDILGAALETLVPKEGTGSLNVEIPKKELSNS